VVHKGLEDFAGHRKGGQAYCAIVFCSEKCAQRIEQADKLVNSVRFDKINIRAVVEVESTDEADYLFMPSTLANSITPLDTSAFEFEKSDTYTADGWVFVRK
jgi:hypothetical protein